MLSRSHNAPQDTLLVAIATKTISLPCNLPAEFSQIATAQNNNNEIQEQTTLDMARVHYVVENGFLFRSVPDGQKLQLIIPSVLQQSLLQYAHDIPWSGQGCGFGKTQNFTQAS